MAVGEAEKSVAAVGGEDERDYVADCRGEIVERPVADGAGAKGRTEARWRGGGPRVRGFSCMEVEGKEN